MTSRSAHWDRAVRFSGPLVWAFHFVALYGGESLFCTRGVASAYTTFAAFATLVAVAAFILLLTAFGRVTADRGADFVDWLAAALTLTSACGVGLTTLSVMLVDACAADRMAL